MPDNLTPPVAAPSATVDEPGRVEGVASTVPTGDVASARKLRRAKSQQRALAEWVVAIGLAVIAAFLIKTFAVQAFVIPSGSMKPTLEIGDRVLVSKFAYDFSDIHHHDVIVFKNPARLPGEPAQLIKRVIGLPGDTIETKDGKVLVNGESVAEPYLPAGTLTRDPQGRDLAALVVPAGHLFVMGDNRGNSRDSRYIGAVDEKLVVGKAFFRLWPVGRLGRL